MSGVLRRSALAVIALFAVPLAAALPARAEMTFRTVAVDTGTCRGSCPEVIVAEGAITSRTPAVFGEFARRAASRRQLRRLVLVHSPGGEVTGALRLGMMLRSIGATVMVARVAHAPDGPARFVGGACASACVYVLAGGRKRIVPPESRVGVHRMRIELVDAGGEGRRLLSARASRTAVQALKGYLGGMGVSPDLVVLSESVPHSDIRVLSPREIARYRLASGRL